MRQILRSSIPKTVNAEEPEWANDFPANTKRMVQRSVGMHYTIVNGTVDQ